MPQIRRRKFKLTISVIGAWTLVILVVGMQNYVSSRLDGRPLSLFDAMTHHVPILAVWAVATPLIFGSVRRWPFLGAAWKKFVPLHLVFGITFVTVINAAWPILYPTTVQQLSRDAWIRTTLANITTWLPLALIVYLVIGAIGHLAYWKSDASREEVLDQVDNSGDRKYLPQVTIRGLNRSFVVPAGDIEWIEASRDHVIYHLGSRTLKERRRLKDVEKSLDPRRFVRIHRSTIAQVARIREMHALEHGDFLVTLDSGARVRLARSRRRALESVLGRTI